jgi:hypothetical protein
VRQARGAFWILISAGLVSASLTVLFLSMRSVLGVDATCGSVVADQPIRPCPGVAIGLMPAAIWAGLIFTGLYVLVAARYHVPSLVSLAWPALFLSLGYNFLDYGIHGQAGFILVGVVFVLMGAGPLVWAVPHLWRVYVRGIDDPKPWHVAATGSAVGAMKVLGRLQRSPDEDMTDSLERLDELHRKGALDEVERHDRRDARLLALRAPRRDRSRHLGRRAVLQLGVVAHA